MFLIHCKYMFTSLTNSLCIYLKYVHPCEKSMFRVTNKIFTATEIRPRGIHILRISKCKEKILSWDFTWFSFNFKMAGVNFNRWRFTSWCTKQCSLIDLLRNCVFNFLRNSFNFRFVMSSNSKYSPTARHRDSSLRKQISYL